MVRRLIFVTVGTHEQPFDRLIEAVDLLKEAGWIQDDVVMQTGACTYAPCFCVWRRMFSYDEMQKYMNEARLIITHGGPASFMMALQRGKMPIVVPRQARYGEHVNNHQVEFVRRLADHMGMIIPVYEMEDLKEKILRYAEHVVSAPMPVQSHNEAFNRDLQKLIDELVEGVDHDT